MRRMPLHNVPRASSARERWRHTRRCRVRRAGLFTATWHVSAVARPTLPTAPPSSGRGFALPTSNTALLCY